VPSERKKHKRGAGEAIRQGKHDITLLLSEAAAAGQARAPRPRGDRDPALTQLASFAVSAVDVALWDLAARRRGLPLWRHAGGHDSRVRAYADGIDLQFPLDRLLRQAG